MKSLDFVKNASKQITRPKISPRFKGTVSRIFFASGFFHESVSPQPQSIPLRPFQIFSEICGDIRNSRSFTGVNDTSGKFFHQFR
jgi:hypothetical protein